MTKNDLLELFRIDDILDLPNAIVDLISGDIEYRDSIYRKLIILNNNDLSNDWFQGIYEEEFAQRNQDKQDFTPNSIGVLLSRITGIQKGNIYEPTAGNGSLLIANWWHRKQNCIEFNIKDHPVECWELSNRSIPILLLNLSIRNIEAKVFHGNVINKEIKAEYVLNSDKYFSIIKKIIK